MQRTPSADRSPLIITSGIVSAVLGTLDRPCAGEADRQGHLLWFRQASFSFRFTVLPPSDEAGAWDGCEVHSARPTAGRWSEAEALAGE